jgi:hypothetical protein
LTMVADRLPGIHREEARAKQDVPLLLKGID